MEDLVSAMRDRVRHLDPPRMTADHAIRLVESCAELERLAAAARTIAADRVQQTRAWRATGSTSAASWMASRTGSTLSQAAITLNNAQRIKQLPAVREAFVSGRLSEVQAAEVSAAAVVDKASEENLVALAQTESVAALREHCRDVRAAAAGDEEAGERIRRSRYFKHWNDREGAIRFDARLAPDDAAPLLAVVKERAARLRADAASSGHRETMEAYAADALIWLAEGSGSTKTVVNVHVSQTALERGHTVAGETCRIDGVGPVTVAGAKRLAARGEVKFLEIDGLDVRRVSHAGRAIGARLRTALETRDPTCVVPECNRRYGLEIDHIIPLIAGGETKLENLARLCRWHHAEKTFHGWRLAGSPGAWIWARDQRRDHGEAGAYSPDG